MISSDTTSLAVTAAIDTHKAAHAAATPYTCDRCGYSCAVKGVFKRHCSRKHPCKPTVSDISQEELFNKYFSSTEKPGTVAVAAAAAAEPIRSVTVEDKKDEATEERPRKALTEESVLEFHGKLAGLYKEFYEIKARNIVEPDADHEERINKLAATAASYVVKRVLQELVLSGTDDSDED